MQVQAARISPVVMELAVEIPADAVKVEVEKAYSTLQRSARVRGFRPGKAPRHVLAHLYSAKVASDVVNAIVNGTLPKALSEKNVQPVNQPQVEAGSFSQGSAFSYKARFEVQPEIEAVVYEGLNLVKADAEATETAVDERIEELRRLHARLEAPDPPRPAENGDVLTVDFTLAIAGKELKDAEGKDVQLELGSSQVLPELDAALLGRKIDDEVDVLAKFPDSHQRKELAGHPGAFHIRVKGVKKRVLPALDDEFAKDVGAYQTLVELRANVHTRLQKALKDQAEAGLAEQIIEQLNEKNPMDVPPSLVEAQCRMMEMDILRSARRSGQRISEDGFQAIHSRVHADAEKKVRAGLLMAAIAKKSEIKVTDQDIQQGMEELATETGKNVAKLRAEYSDPQRRQILIGMILEDKVLDLIESKAVMTAASPGTSTSATAQGQEGPSNLAKE
ncbi:MAG: trigger factor [Polyangiaceae bacterium]